MIYGYARVSSRDQNLERQIVRLREFGVEEECLFCDKKSGGDFCRTAYISMVKKLRAKDLLVVTSIDRLGRNYDCIIREWSHLTGTIGADILVLDMPLLDTRSKLDSLVGKFISDIVLQVLSFVAENERANIRARQAEGIALAKANGVRFGRPKKQQSDVFLQIAAQYRDGKISQRAAAETLGISRQNFFYHFKNIYAET